METLISKSLPTGFAWSDPPIRIAAVGNELEIQVFVGWKVGENGEQNAESLVWAFPAVESVNKGNQITQQLTYRTSTNETAQVGDISHWHAKWEGVRSAKNAETTDCAAEDDTD